MEIASREVCCLWHLLLYLIKYVHDDLISDLDFFTFLRQTFKFDTNVKFQVLLDSWICNYTPAQCSFDLEWKGFGMNW